MMVYIEKDEWYPVYTVVGPDSWEWEYHERRRQDLNDEIYQRYQRAYEEWNEVQAIVSKLYIR